MGGWIVFFCKDIIVYVKPCITEYGGASFVSYIGLFYTVSLDARLSYLPFLNWLQPC